MILLLLALAASAAEICPADLDGDGATDPDGDFRRWACVELIVARAALDGDKRAAVFRLTQLLRSEFLSTEPAYALASYHLGRLHQALGQTDAARTALDACIRSGHHRNPCLELRGAIDQEAEAVRVVPTRWTFDSPDHGFFHPRSYWDKGSIRLRQEDTNGVLSWVTEVDGTKEDLLVVAFSAPSPSPRAVRFRIRSMEVRAELEVELVDEDGQIFAPRSPSVEVERGDWITVEVSLRDVVPLAPGQTPLRPGALHQLILRDATGLTGAIGRNELRIDDFEVR